MTTYQMFQRKDGRNIISSESKSPYPPSDERGREAIASLYRVAQKAGLKESYGVSSMDKNGSRVWYDQFGRPVDEENAFRRL